MSVDTPQQIQRKLSVGDPTQIQDGLHNLIQTPEFRSALAQAIAIFAGAVFEPSLLELLRRYLQPGDRNDARSYSVRTAALGGPIKIAERDPSRQFLMISNLGAQTVYVGGRQVTIGGLNDPSGGIPIPAANYPPLVIPGDIGELWAITGTDGQDLRVLDVAGGI